MVLKQTRGRYFLGDELRITKLDLALMEDGRKQREIARLADMPAPRLCEYSKGKRPIPLYRLMRLSTVLHRNPDQLVGWAEDISPIGTLDTMDV